MFVVVMLDYKLIFDFPADMQPDGRSGRIVAITGKASGVCLSI